jgi:hypothetical protein
MSGYFCLFVDCYGFAVVIVAIIERDLFVWIVILCIEHWLIGECGLEFIVRFCLISILWMMIWSQRLKTCLETRPC